MKELQLLKFQLLELHAEAFIDSLIIATATFDAPADQNTATEAPAI